MLTKHLLTISLLLPLVAVSATAHAGSTISLGQELLAE
jgi:hypothetical protein